MSVEIHFGAGPSVTKQSPMRGEVRGLGVGGNEVGSDLCVHRSPGRRDFEFGSLLPKEKSGMRARIGYQPGMLS
jgi:hypothetical protein